MGALAVVLAVLAILASVAAVKREDFKKCDQSGFCTRQRAFAELVSTTDFGSPLQLQPGTLKVSESALEVVITADVLHSRINQVFQLHIDLLKDGVVRARMWEKNFPNVRWRGLDDLSLVGKPERVASYHRVSTPESEQASGVYEFALGPKSAEDEPARLSLRIHSSPLVVEMLHLGVPVIALNEQGYLNIEHIRAKADTTSEYPDLGDIYGNLGLEADLKSKLENGMWDEMWKGTHQDTKPKGSSENESQTSFEQS